MGKVVHSVASIFTGGGSSPKVSKDGENQIAADQKAAQASRQPLYMTEGGVLGEDLSPDDVQKRDTLLGN